MKVKFWSYTVNGGDGSAYPKFFRTERKAEDYAQQQEDDGYADRFTEDIDCHELEFDQDGNLITENE